MPLEIAAFSAPSAIIALSSLSADRIELCANPSVGGITPSLSSFRAVKNYVLTPSSSTSAKCIPINVMIRPARGGTFIYSDGESDLMLSEIKAFDGAGADGFVFGVLRISDECPELEIDIERCKALLSATHGKPSTFHRAFDTLPPATMLAQLEVLITLGFTSVLTSGGGSTAIEGQEMLRSLVERASGRIEVIVGGGVRSSSLGELVRGIHSTREGGNSGIEGWWHSSAIVDGGEMASAEEVMALKRRLRLSKV